MNELVNMWQKLSSENFIYTKHNYIDVYNYSGKIMELYNKAKNIYKENKGYTGESEKLYSLFDHFYYNLSSEDKKLVDNEIDLIMKQLPEYIKIQTQLRSVNKYKSKAFEIIVKEILDNFYDKLEPENSFETIFKKLELDFKENQMDFIEAKNNFSVYKTKNIRGFDFNKSKKYQYDFKIGFNIDGNVELINQYVVGQAIHKDFFKDDKNTYAFKIEEKTPVLRLGLGKNIFFYMDENNNICKKNAEFFEDIIFFDKEDKNKQNKVIPFQEFYIISTPKEFLQKYYIKSLFLKKFEEINCSHKEYKIEPMLKQYNYKKRPDLWSFENNELVFFEVKFNEFTEFKEENLINTMNYIMRFNQICKNNDFKLSVYEVNIVHINNVISENILKIKKKWELKGYKINLLHLRDIIFEKNLEIPCEVRVYKEKNKTIRELKTAIDKPKNIIIDLTEVC